MTKWIIVVMPRLCGLRNCAALIGPGGTAYFPFIVYLRNMA
jgi:hypothetical protein